MIGLYIPDEYVVPIGNTFDGGWEAVAVRDVPAVVAAELRRIAADRMDPETSKLRSEPPLVNRTRALWADYLRFRAAELDGRSTRAAESHAGHSPSPTHAPPPVDAPASLSGPGIGAAVAAATVAVAEEAYAAAEGGHVRAKRWRELTDARHALAAAVRDTDVAVREQLWAAFVAGFAASSTGFNGEWPYDDRPVAMAADLAPVFERWATGGDRS